ncbi:uncharacterized protein LOC111887661 isoform X1 [Lactuca sativa]|uniref:Orn/Lys/Arg decarboxylases family 1 pyridoxal-P attachment site domain-containing protein n=1 Tax=Lactuca sativa TaxID=4236 RepID=A0A9R1V0S9_LACSA|nr:uncharacterized protein LOC111887661 isoform X1 [Lactuca sativa]KAJ0196238.1 hypothetical protein LSAT_V11C700365370 [Lactuca sativa]
MASAILHLSLGYSSTTRACISEERNHEKVKLLDKIKSIKDKTVISNSQQSKHHKLPPLVSALKASSEQKVASFHFPGHNRGRAAPSSLSNLIGLQPFHHDLPELPELDNLFTPVGPILDAQKQAAELFGATETWFLVGGTTCGIQASVMATCSPGDTLILPRNSHISAFSSMVLSGVIPKYITPEYDSDWDIASGVTPSQVEKAMKELETKGQKPSAVLITSPTYHGICTNLQQISSLCHSQNTPLIVDEAHGAHFAFHNSFPPSALHQGADLAIQSTHKVLSSLTQSSMLHVSGNIINREKICQCLQTLQTTSPSYLLLASLDASRAQISENPKIFDKAVEIAAEAKSLIKKIPGIGILDSGVNIGIDPLRITVGVWELGISGFEADDILYENYGVVSELVGTRSITFAINLGTRRDDVVRLVSGLKYLSESRIPIPIPIPNDVRVFMGMCSGMRLSPREAFFASKKKVSFRESIGEICGELVCPYPPGIPLLIPGEVITEEVLRYLVEVKNNGGFISGAADSSLSTIVVCS